MPPGLQVQRFLRKLSCHHSSPLLSSPRQNLPKYLVSNCKISPQPTVQCVESKPLPGTRYHPCLVPWRLFTLGETRRQLRQERERHKPSFSQGSNFVVDRQYSSIAGSSPGLAANILLSPQILNLSRLEFYKWRKWYIPMPKALIKEIIIKSLIGWKPFLRYVISTRYNTA